MVSGFRALCCAGVSEFQSSELKLLGSAATEALAGVLPGFTRVAAGWLGLLTGELAAPLGDVCAMGIWANPGTGIDNSPVEISKNPRCLRDAADEQAKRVVGNFRYVKLGFLPIADF